MSFTKKVVIALLLTYALSAVNAFAGISSDTEWFDSLIKPSINPPSWVFGPVWFTLYTLMAVAFAKVWSTEAKGKKIAMVVFLIHLIPNGIWTILFFGQQMIGGALVDIVILDILVIAVLYLFYKVDKTAGYLIVPYLAWVLFATLLNYQFYILYG